MSVRRKAIRKGIQTILKGKTDAGANVFSNLASATWCEDIPLIVVYARQEEIEQLNVSPREYRRALEISIEIIAQGPEDPNASEGKFLEDILDDIAEQVETELGRDETVGQLDRLEGNDCALVDELILNNVEFEYRGEGKKPSGSVKLIYNAMYTEKRPASVDQQAEAYGIADFKTAHAEWKVGHDDDAPDNNVEAEDTVTIPE